jgi:hypothetical protein
MVGISQTVKNDPCRHDDAVDIFGYRPVLNTGPISPFRLGEWLQSGWGEIIGITLNDSDVESGKDAFR